METRTNKTPIPLKDVALYIMLELNMPMSAIVFYGSVDLVSEFDGDERRVIFPGTKLRDKIVELEQKHNIKIYAVTHDYLAPIGEMYSFLCVSSYEEDWDHMVRPLGKGQYMAYAYVQNVQDNLCSEFGYVAVSTAGGMLTRVG